MKTNKFLILIALIIGILSGCVKDEVYQGPPAISQVGINPQSPGNGQDVTITATVTDQVEIKSVKLFYKTGQGALQTVDMAQQKTTNVTAVYHAIIPGQESGITVSYYVEAENSAGLRANYPAGAPQVMASYTIGAPSILLNEVYSRGTPDAPDWVEIFNNSDGQVDISGYRIYDAGAQSGSKPKKEFPSGSVIPARGFIVIVVDDGTESGFGMSSGGEEIWFESPTGNILDNVQFPAMENSQSYGRYPDGSANWQILNSITRGSANYSGTSPEIILKVNEIYSRGTTENPDWVEIYNAGTNPADLSGWKIYDIGGQGGTKPKKEFPQGIVLQPGAFVVIVVDDGTESGFGLSSGGETIWLENPEGQVKDEVAFPALEEGQSYGCYPDGSSQKQVLFVPTPGAANDNTVPPPPANIRLNEIYSRGDVANPDWAEVYNAGSAAVDLSTWKIYDNGGQGGTKPKMEFPSGTIISPGDFIIIILDDGSAAGFGLSSGGEQIWLEKPDGNMADEVTFPALEVGQSYGRFPDGSGNWQILNVVTPGTANNNTTPPPAITVKINEIYSRGTTVDPDWVEIYNASTVAISLDGWKIYDNGGQGGSKPKMVFPDGVLLEPGDFYVIVTDDGSNSGFGLSSNGETVWLENPEAEVVDEVSFPALEVDQSYGRKPDGSDNLVIFTQVTKGSSNNNAATLPKKK